MFDVVAINAFFTLEYMIEPGEWVTHSVYDRSSFWQAAEELIVYGGSSEYPLRLRLVNGRVGTNTFKAFEWTPENVTITSLKGQLEELLHKKYDYCVNVYYANGDIKYLKGASTAESAHDFMLSHLSMASDGIEYITISLRVASIARPVVISKVQHYTKQDVDSMLTQANVKSS